MRRGFTGWLVVVGLPVTLGGCFLAPGSPGRPSPGAISGPPVYEESCQGCHGDGVGRAYAASVHAARGIQCAQCHQAGNHPDFAQPVRDATCGGCHQAEFQQTLASKHFATRLRHGLDRDRTARSALRRDGFVAVGAGGRRFVGDAAAGELGGRLCAACHYDEHRFRLASVQRRESCLACHGDRANHFPDDVAATGCVSCHVRRGEAGGHQMVNSHRFAVPGSEDASR